MPKGHWGGRTRSLNSIFNAPVIEPLDPLPAQKVEDQAMATAFGARRFEDHPNAAPSSGAARRVTPLYPGSYVGNSSAMCAL